MRYCRLKEIFVTFSPLPLGEGQVVRVCKNHLYKKKLLSAYARHPNPLPKGEGTSNLRFAILSLRFAVALFLGGMISHAALAADLTVELGNSQGVTSVGAIQRWDQDGNHRKLPDPKAKIDAPAADAVAEKTGADTWTFKNLPTGKYDLVILAKDRVRIEGFQYVPVKEFDPFFPPDSSR